MPDHILEATDSAIGAAASRLLAGGLVGIPTETVYGLAADATNPDAVARLFETKGRPLFNPLIAHVGSVEAVATLARLTGGASLLAGAFWPGPLTLVLDARESCTVCSLARAGLDTIAIRVPTHPVARKLLRQFGRPIVAPSANPSGKVSPTRAEHVAADFGDQVSLILDGGASESGLESTIVDARGDHPILLRHGPIPAEEIEKLWPGLVEATGESDKPLAPGQLLRHYAPNARLRLNATEAEPGEALIGFGDIKGTVSLSEKGSLTEAAARLFDVLRHLDKSHDRIAVAPIPNDGLGAAINDRLTRAADSG